MSTLRNCLTIQCGASGPCVPVIRDRALVFTPEGYRIANSLEIPMRRDLRLVRKPAKSKADTRGGTIYFDLPGLYRVEVLMYPQSEGENWTPTPWVRTIDLCAFPRAALDRIQSEGWDYPENIQNGVKPTRHSVLERILNSELCTEERIIQSLESAEAKEKGWGISHGLHGRSINLSDYGIW